jgi:hypothetical protein
VIVIYWLYALSLAYVPESGLEPWVAAGVILYGLAFVLAALIPGLFGILWAKHLASGVPSICAGVANLVWKIGTFILFVGLGAAVAALTGTKK